MIQCKSENDKPWKSSCLTVSLPWKSSYLNVSLPLLARIAVGKIGTVDHTIGFLGAWPKSYDISFPSPPFTTCLSCLFPVELLCDELLITPAGLPLVLNQVRECRFQRSEEHHS